MASGDIVPGNPATLAHRSAEQVFYQPNVFGWLPEDHIFHVPALAVASIDQTS